MGDNGPDLVDLTLEWESKDLNGDKENFSSKPESPDSTKPEPPDPDRIHEHDAVHEGKPPPDHDATHERGPPPDPAPPDAVSFTIALSELHDYRLALASEVRGQIEEFEAMRDRLLADEGWMFWAPSREYASGLDSYQVDLGDYREADYGPSREDPDPAKTWDMVVAHRELLQGVGGIIHLVGRMMGALNDVGQIYAGADRGAWIDTPEMWVR